MASGLAALLLLPVVDFFFHSSVAHMSTNPSHISVLIPLGPKPFKSYILSEFVLSFAFFLALDKESEYRSMHVKFQTFLAIQRS